MAWLANFTPARWIGAWLGSGSIVVDTSIAGPQGEGFVREAADVHRPASAGGARRTQGFARPRFDTTTGRR